MVQLVSSFGGERALIERQLRRFRELPKRERHDGLSIVRIGVLPAERVDEATGRIDLPELA